MKRRIISALMTLVMLVSLIPLGASAAAEGPEPEELIPEASEETLSEAIPETTEENLPEELPEEAESAEAVPGAELMSEENGEDSLLDRLEEDKEAFLSLFHTSLYVSADPAAGLDGRVAVSFGLTGCVGTLYLPGSADTSALFLSWADEELTLSQDDVTYVSGTAPVAPAGEKAYYLACKGDLCAVISVRTVQGSAQVAGMFLELDESLGTIAAMNADEIHETSCYGTVSFDGELYPYMSMKGRGNSTWDLAKKPYNLTFYKKGDYDKKQKTELISGVKAKKWSLLANYLDTSLIRNKVGLDLADKMGIGLKSRFVDLWMNGEYLGNYLLTPKNDYDAPDGGYVLENDNYLSDDPQFDLPGMQEPASIDGFHNLMSIKDIGDDAVDAGEDASTIEAYFLRAWDALRDYDSEEYQNYFDMDSWAKMFLMYEMTKTYDMFSGSLLMHRDGLTENDKLVAGPAWDMDNSFGRTIVKFLSGVGGYNQLTAEGWYMDSVGVLADDDPVSLLQELQKHPSFKQRVSEIYNDYRGAFEGICADISAQQAVLGASAAMDYDLWGYIRLSTYYTPVPLTLGSGDYVLNYEPTFTWQSYVNNMRTYVTKRVQFLTDNLGAEYPVGEITGETEVQAGDTLELTAALTAGNTNNSYVWQSKAGKGDWQDIDGADGAVLKLTVSAADDGTQYRCLVKNAGGWISMVHGKPARASAQTKLDSVSITVTDHEHRYEPRTVEPTCMEDGYTLYLCRCGDSYKDAYVTAPGHSYVDGFCTRCGEKDPAARYGTRTDPSALTEGALTLVMSKKELGEYTFKAVSGGWTIRDGDGRYVAAEGKELVLSDSPFVWTYSNGIFSARVRLSFTSLGKKLGLSHMDTVYLTVSKDSLAISPLLGTRASFLKTTEYLIG